MTDPQAVSLLASLWPRPKVRIHLSRCRPRLQVSSAEVVQGGPQTHLNPFWKQVLGA